MLTEDILVGSGRFDLDSKDDATSGFIRSPAGYRYPELALSCHGCALYSRIRGFRLSESALIPESESTTASGRAPGNWKWQHRQWRQHPAPVSRDPAVTRVTSLGRHGIMMHAHSASEISGLQGTCTSRTQGHTPRFAGVRRSVGKVPLRPCLPPACPPGRGQGSTSRPRAPAGYHRRPVPSH